MWTFRHICRLIFVLFISEFLLQISYSKPTEFQLLAVSNVLKEADEHWTEPDQYDLLFSCLRDCGWNSAIVFTDNATSSPTTSHLLDFLHHSSMPFIHYELTSQTISVEQIEEIVWNSYRHRRIFNFVWLVEDLGYFLLFEAARNVFEREKRSFGALLPNKVQFVLLSHETELESTEKRFSDVIFDHVALLVANEHDLHPDVSYTLMWRENRLREFQRIFYNVNSSEEGARCRIFPNLYFGLNERPLVALAKEWLPMMYKEVNPVLGQLEYVGFTADTVAELALSLNFTFTYIPAPGEDDKLTWDEIPKMIERHVADFGAILYLTNSALFANYSVTYPVITSNISGVYAFREESTYLELTRLFDTDVFVCLAFILVFTTGQYIVSSIVLSWAENKRQASELCSNCPRMNQNKEQQSKVIPSISEKMVEQEFPRSKNAQHGLKPASYICSNSFCKASGIEAPSFENSEKSAATKCDVSLGTLKQPPSSQDSNSSKCSSRDCSPTTLLSYRAYILDTIFIFIGTCFNQCSAPSTPYFSIRVLLWSWRLMLMVLAATFTGNLTADFVGSKHNHPFRTYQELLNNDEYKWGIFKDSSLINVMKNAKEGSDLKKLYDGMIQFAQDDPLVMGTTEEVIDKLATQNYVAFLDSTMIQYVLETRNIPNLVRISETLMRTDQGFIFSKTSELEELFSRHIMRLTDFGFADVLFRKQSESVKAVVTDSIKKTSLSIGHIVPTICICSWVSVIAVSVLIAEFLLIRLRTVCTTSD